MQKRRIPSTFGAGGQWPASAPEELGHYSDEQKEIVESHQHVYDFYQGTRAVLAAAEKYLPREEGEKSDKAYEARKNKGVVFNKLRKTINTATGKPFSKEVEAVDVPAAVEEFLKQVDRGSDRRNITSFSRDIYRECWLRGGCGVLVDAPKAPVDQDGNALIGTTLANASRPYWSLYSTPDILGWAFAEDQSLAMIRFKDSITVESGAAEMDIQAVLVVVPGHWAKYRTIEAKSRDRDVYYALEDSGRTNTTEIQYQHFYADREGQLRGRSPAIDLADLQRAHYQSLVDQRHILHIARSPILFAKKIESFATRAKKVAKSAMNVIREPKKILIGVTRLVHGTEADSDVRWVEIQGGSIGSGRDDLKDWEERMDSMAVDLLNTKTKEMTATEAGIHAEEGDTMVHTIAKSEEEGLNKLLRMTAQRMGETLPETAHLSIYTDFSTPMSSIEEARLIIEMDGLSIETKLSELKRRDLLDPTFSTDDEWQRLAEEAKRQGIDLFSEPPEITASEAA